MEDMQDDEWLISMSQAVHSNPDPQYPAQHTPTAPRNGHARLHAEDGLHDPAAALLPEAMQHRAAKDISDAIYPDLHLPSFIMQFVDTPLFQRLRHLKQLGCTELVYPGAKHTRFEHSLGVAYLAFLWGSRVLNNFSRECDVEQRDVLLLMLAGACHDLGHGPFSHMFESYVLPGAGIHNWHHEEMSAQLLEAIVDDHNIDVPREDVRRVQQLIHCPKSGPPAQEQKKWMFEVVANWRNSLDVDKLDYLCRDSYYCSLPHPIQLARLQKNFRVIGDEICYKQNMFWNIYKVYEHRADMHRTVYQHPKVRAIECMVADALLAADRSLHFTQHVAGGDTAAFCGLDDSILQTVKHFGLVVPDYRVHEQYDGIVQAQHIIRRLENRQLYKFVSETLVPWEDVERGQWQQPTPADIATCCSPGGIQLRPEDIILSETKVNFAMQDKNPLSNIHFYHGSYDLEKHPLRTNDVTQMSINRFQEVKLRIYSRRADTQYVEAMYRAFERWQGRRFEGRVSIATPLKSLRHQPTLATKLSCSSPLDTTGSIAAAHTAALNGDLSRKRARHLCFGNPLTPVAETL